MSYLLYLLHSIASSFSTVRFSRKEIQKTMTLVVGEARDWIYGGVVEYVPSIHNMGRSKEEIGDGEILTD